MAAFSQVPIMPELAGAHYGFHHNLDSALESLAHLGISPRRVTIRMAGPGWLQGWIVVQNPTSGTPLTPDVLIELSVAGLGLFHHLPVGMWDRGAEGEIGTQEIVELFDDPFQKAAHWIWEGARIFELRPENRAECGQWISVFGLRPKDWPESAWYELALMLPSLQRLAGREEGIRLAFRQLLGLEILEIRSQRRFLTIEASQRSGLGTQNRELGINSVIGTRLEGLRSLEIRVGPIPLAIYDEMQTSKKQRCLDAVLGLCMPLHQHCTVSYEVLDRSRAPRLGIAEANARLAVNSYLGKAAA